MEFVEKNIYKRTIRKSKNYKCTNTEQDISIKLLRRSKAKRENKIAECNVFKELK